MAASMLQASGQVPETCREADRSHTIIRRESDTTAEEVERYVARPESRLLRTFIAGLEKDNKEKSERTQSNVGRRSFGVSSRNFGVQSHQLKNVEDAYTK